MDNVAVSRRKQNKKGNKENAQPEHGSKSFPQRDVSRATTSVAPLNLKSNERDGSQAVKPQQGGGKVTALYKAKTVQSDGRGAAATDAPKRQTLSRAFLTEQSVKYRQVVAEAPKPPAAVPPSKSAAPGMYKGKIVQSKIGSIWKSSVAVGGANPKPSAPKVESQKVGHLTKTRSKSVTDLPARGVQKPKPTRCNSVSDALPPVSRRPVTRRPTTGVRSALPPARTVPATQAGPWSRNTAAVTAKGKGTQSSKPMVPVTDKKADKPPVSSTLSQYRLTTETAEEKRAKLSEWLASKGKSLKRPATVTAAQPKIRVAGKNEVHLQSQRAPEPAPSLAAPRPGSAAAQPEDNQRPGETAHNPTPRILDTTLDLLDDSYVGLPAGPDVGTHNIVLNLCDALEAMATPSTCEDEPPQVTDECNEVATEHGAPTAERGEPPQVTDEVATEHGTPKAKRGGEPKKEVSEEAGVKLEADENGDKEMESVEAVESSDDEKGVIETTPKMGAASTVKYSVTTTPYLQSVRKAMEGEAGPRGSLGKSSIKDLKFLTPVRRSTRIQRTTSRLPEMLQDHDACVSSLAELGDLDDDANAYIYRRNPALL